MPKLLPAARLRRVVTAKKRDVDHWKEGVDLRDRTNLSIADILSSVAESRWRLAKNHLRQAKACLSNKRPLYRAAVSRYYYAMYHLMRVVVFIAEGGDDHEEHSKLPQHVPSDFPTPNFWSNALKSAREHRNEADYDPFARGEGHWAPIVRTIGRDAKLLQKAAKDYLATSPSPFR